MDSGSQKPSGRHGKSERRFWTRETPSTSSNLASPAPPSLGQGAHSAPPGATVSGASSRWRSSPRSNFSPPYPSPSVEPPQVSVYKFNTSPSPAAFLGVHHSAQYYEPVVQANQLSFPHPEPQAPAQTSIPLQDLHEDKPLLTHDVLTTEALPATTQPPLAASSSSSSLGVSTEHTQPAQVAPSAATASAPPKFKVIPRKSVMNPAAYKLIPTTRGVLPPEDLVLHAEVTRHGGTVVPVELDAAEEASYQVDITPPVGHRAPPPNIIIDPAMLQTKQEPARPRTPVQKPDLDTTWSSTGHLSSNSLVPPVANVPMSSPNPEMLQTTSPANGTQSLSQRPSYELPQPQPQPAGSVNHYITDRPTCSINIVCYRSGAKGCSLQQIQCVLRSKFPDDQSFESMLAANEHLIHTDVEFFETMRRLFEKEMCDFFRRWFSLKSLRAFRVLAYTPTTRPVVVPFDDFVLQEMMYAYRNPSKLASEDDWIQWVFRLRRQDKRHAVEFVEGWNSTRVAIAGTIPWLSSCIVGIAWTAAGGDVQSAFTVASFILTSSSVILALLAIISSIESSGRSGL